MKLYPSNIIAGRADRKQNRPPACAEMVFDVASLTAVDRLQADPQRKFFSAAHKAILSGATTDIYFVSMTRQRTVPCRAVLSRRFVRTFDILEQLGLLDVPVTAEIFCRRDGILAGVEEVTQRRHPLL